MNHQDIMHTTYTFSIDFLSIMKIRDMWKSLNRKLYSNDIQKIVNQNSEIINILFQTFVVFAGFLALAAGRPNAPLVAVGAPLAAVGAPLNLAPTLVRAPAHDSASIESHRLGGNFAYAVAEAHAYAQVTPQVSTITHPVAETTVVHEPATIAKVTPGQVITTKHIPAPVIAHQPILKSEPVIQVRELLDFAPQRKLIGRLRSAAWISW